MQFDNLDVFTQAYVEALLFTECHCDNPELDGLGFEDISAALLHSIIADCAEFQRANETLIRRAWFASETKYMVSQAGHDFWLTRNGHGAGFWDRGLGAIGTALSDVVGHGKRWPAMEIYKGDDGKLYAL